MIKQKYTWRKTGFFVLCFLTLAIYGCFNVDKKMERVELINTELKDTKLESAELQSTELKISEEVPDQTTQSPDRTVMNQPGVAEVDWSEYFGGLNGAAVLYDTSAGQFSIYNRPLAEIRRSPCSTFKIISSLMGLEAAVIPSGDSTRKWSGETFWNQEWNRDSNFEEAFKTSCIWYFREVIDELGPETVEVELNRLQYGNCDISDWEGKLNTSNNKTALRGFWVESSLKISALEQVEVMERIFGDQSVYNLQSLTRLKQAMKLDNAKNPEYSIYGKTGMGKVDGEAVDAWFTGFAETSNETIYFCVYLGKTYGMEISSSKAREIAVNLIREGINKS